MNFKNIFPLEIVNKLSNIKLVYNGVHNTTYIAFLDGQKVQIRVCKNNYVNFDNEKLLYDNNNNYIFYNKGNLIKKWLEGSTLENVILTKKIKTKIFDKLKNFHQQKIDKLEKMDWMENKIPDLKYKNLIKKYQNEPLVTTHGDLKLKNIILVENTQEIELIDFEWSRKNSVYFDYVFLYKYLNISQKEIIEYFNLSVEKFNDFLYMVEIFENFWLEKNNL